MRDSGEDAEDTEFDGLGRGELSWIKLVGFMALGKTGMEKIGKVWRIGMLGPKVFPVEAASRGNNISN